MALTTFDFVITTGANNNGNVVGFWFGRWSSSINVRTFTPPGGREIALERIAHAQDVDRVTLWLVPTDGNTVTDWSDLVPDRIVFSRGDLTATVPITVDYSSADGTARMRLTQDDPAPPVTTAMEAIFGQTGLEVNIQFQYGDDAGLPLLVGDVAVTPRVGDVELAAVYVGNEKVFG